jgi:hypothetical protein
VALEFEQCGGSADTCEDALKSRRSLTLVIEVKLTPQAQFSDRRALPAERAVALR